MRDSLSINKRTWRAALTLCASMLATASVPAAGLPRHGVAVYSDLCLEKASGDIGGQRITLHRFAEGDTAIYEFTAGGLSMPVVASDTSIDDKTGVLTFTVTVADGDERTILGKFSRDGRALTLTGGYCGAAAYPMRLSRVSDFSRPLRDCKPCPAQPDTPAPDTPADAAPGAPDTAAPAVPPALPPAAPAKAPAAITPPSTL
jgi:hypothetical protein